MSQEPEKYLCGYCDVTGTGLELWIHENSAHQGPGKTFQIRDIVTKEFIERGLHGRVFD